MCVNTMWIVYCNASFDGNIANKQTKPRLVHNLDHFWRHNDVLVWPGFLLCCSLVMAAQGITYPYERLRGACSDLPGLGLG